MMRVRDMFCYRTIQQGKLNFRDVVEVFILNVQTAVRFTAANRIALYPRYRSAQRQTTLGTSPISFPHQTNKKTKWRM